MKLPQENSKDEKMTEKKKKNKENDLLTGNPEFICS